MAKGKIRKKTEGGDTLGEGISYTKGKTIGLDISDLLSSNVKKKKLGKKAKKSKAARLYGDWLKD